MCASLRHAVVGDRVIVVTPVLVINVLGRMTAAFLALRAITVRCKRSHELSREVVGESLIGELIGALKQRTA